MDWRPTASFDALRARAALLATIRAFFAERGVLEVDTPSLARAGVTDLHLHGLTTQVQVPEGPVTYHLQTSPEYAMKRLLAAGAGPIYQIAKAFRDDETGRMHNPEFTMLEWYRPGFDHHALMDEMDGLLAATLGTATAERRTYTDLFDEHLDIDPHQTDAATLRSRTAQAGIDAVGLDDADRDTWLHLLFSHVIEPHLGRANDGRKRPTFVLDYPASQAALARVRTGDPPVAERFEVYIQGVELANGFHELSDAAEQRRRFDADLESRAEAGLPTVCVDERLLAALDAGLPPCAGVALGVDRLLMIATDARSIDEVIAFPIDRA